MKILLVLNKPNREQPIMEAIKKEILHLKPDAIIEILAQFPTGFSFNKYVFNFKPDVILTFPFKCIGFSQWYYLFKFFLKTKVIIFPTEGVLNFSNERDIEGACGIDRYGKKLVDNELFWGGWTAKKCTKHLLLQGKISSQDRIGVCGYPRLESYFTNESHQKSPLPGRIQNKISNYTKESVILFISGFQIGNYSTQNFHDAGDLNMKDYSHVFINAMEMAKRFRNKWIFNVKKTALENPDNLIVCKIHPIERKEDYYNEYQGIKNILLVYEGIQLPDLMDYVGVLFHYGSTTLVDSYLSKTPSVFVYTDESSIWYSDYGWPSSEKIKVNEIPSAVKKYLKGDIVFEMNSNIKKVLLDIFNIEYGKKYRPSMEIAKIILDKTPPQKIYITDPYFLKAVTSIIYARTLGRFVNLFKKIKRQF